MKHNLKIPHLNLQKTHNKKIKSQSSTRRTNKYYSPDCQSSNYNSYQRFYSPRRIGYEYLDVSKYRNMNMYTGEEYGLSRGEHQIQTFPNDYLDYQPQFPVYPQFQTKNKFIKQYEQNLRGPSWQKAENDQYMIHKNEMYAQTDRVMTNNKASQTQYTLNFHKEASKNKIQSIHEQNHEQQEESNSLQVHQQKREQNSQIFGIEDQNNSYWKKQNDLLNIQKISQNGVNNSKSQQNIYNYFPNPVEKKTFSQAILDQLLQKDEAMYQQKYNHNNRFTQVIVGKVQKTVKENKNEIHQRIQKKQLINNIQIKNNSNGKIYQNSTNLPQIKQNIYPQNSYPQAHPFQHLQPKHLNRQSTVNVIINKSQERGRFLRESGAQTNDQSNQISRNQVMQTQGIGNHIILERLSKNITDDKDFRKRINQKTDQFHKINIKFEEDDLVRFEELVNSKDAYIKYSKEFLGKLNKILEENKKQREGIRRQQDIHRITVHGPPPIQQLRPPPIQPNVQNFPMVVRNLSLGPQQNVIVSRPIHGPALLPQNPQFPTQIYHIPPPAPQHIVQQVPLVRRSPAAQEYQNHPKK